MTLTERWMSAWAVQLQAAVERALRDGVSDFPFEADHHQVGPPAPRAEIALLRQRSPWMPEDLVALHRQVGPVTLPDICNGYFVHPLKELLALLDVQDRADVIGEPGADGIDVVVFGSNGGGDLYALATTDGRVFRLRGTSYVGGVYARTRNGVIVVGADLRDFLERLLSTVNAFAANGAILDL
nr:SMI1/KNR4 family protein [Micromonospora sp. NBC_00855]